MVTLGEVVAIAKTPECLGIQDRDKIVTYLKRAIGNLYNKAKWDLSLATVDVSTGGTDFITLPSEVGVPEGITVNGRPALLRNDWYEYNINNGGGCTGAYAQMFGTSERTVPYVDVKEFVPVFLQIDALRYFTAVCLDATDSGEYVRVFGKTIDPTTGDVVNATSINPETNELEEGIFVRLQTQNTQLPEFIPTVQLQEITRVIKPVTKGPVKLLAITDTLGGNPTTVGFYEPHETNPRYRRLKLNSGGADAQVRIKYKKPLDAWRYVYDYDVVPVPHLEVIVAMLRATRKYDTSDYEGGASEEIRAVTMMHDNDNANKQGSFSIQVAPGCGFGTMFWG